MDLEEAPLQFKPNGRSTPSNMTETIKFYEVGGAVRDEIMGISSKDVDFAVEAPSYEDMVKALRTTGFHIFQDKPEFFTAKAKVPPNHILRKRTDVADFVLCRKDSATGDGRRPDSVEPGTILDDLARRDFTVNAIAKDPLTGEYIDPHGGREDIENNLLRFVGDPNRRIAEDGLRVLRGYRFTVTKDLRADEPTWEALRSREAAAMLRKVSIERVSDELFKMFSHDTASSIDIVSLLPPWIHEAIFRDGLWLMPTLRK